MAEGIDYGIEGISAVESTEMLREVAMLCVVNDLF